MGTQLCANGAYQTITRCKKWYIVTKIVPTTGRKNCSTDREKLLKFEAEGREFAKILRSLEQFVQPVKGQTSFGNRMLF